MSTELTTWLHTQLAKQTPHPVRPRIELVPGTPVTWSEITIRTGPILEVIDPQDIVRRIAQRQRVLELERTDPLRFLCEPEEYRRIDLEVVRKRLAHPGVPLALWLSGGIRSSKTEFVTRRISANFWFTENAWCWGFHETDTTSRSIQQARVARFIPPEMNPDSGKHRKDKHTKFSYSEGTGFTGSEFVIYWKASDEHKHEHTYGGRFEFRFYGQDPGTMVGQELTCATCDELVPPNVIKLVDDRLLTRSQDTSSPVFMARMLEAERLLLDGQTLPLPLLGAVYHGWNTISFTPKEGWTASASLLLQGAQLYDFYDPRPMVQKAMQQAIDSMPTEAARLARAAHFAAHPWTLGSITEVPRFAQPVDPLKLVAFLPTYANAFKGNWPGAVESIQNRPDEEIKIKLFGVVERNVASLLGFNRARHVQPETALPHDGTIYEVADPAPKKPWVIKWYLADPLGRLWIVQEWPCPTWEIPGHGYPGLWATPSESNKLNGDKGPAQRLPLAWNYDDYTRLIWQGRARLARRLRQQHGERLRVRTHQRPVEWRDRPDWTLDTEFVHVARTYMDSRFAGAPTINNGQNTELIDELLRVENAAAWERASGAREEVGLIMLKNALAEDLLSLPGLLTLDECANTQFAWNTYTLPEHSDTTRSNDEACKDFVDPDRYIIQESPRHREPITDTAEWGGY